MKRLAIIFILLNLFLTQCKEADTIDIDSLAPAEVSNYNVELLDLDISVTWTNPTDIDFRGINVVLEDNSDQIISEVWLEQDSTAYTFKNVESGEYDVLIKTMDKNGNVSDGVRTSIFNFDSEAPTNIANVQYEIKYNTVKLSWDPVDPGSGIESIHISWLDNSVEVPATNTSFIATEFPNGDDNYISYYTESTKGYTSATSSSPAQTIDFPFVRVEGNGHDFYMAIYETTALEFDTFLKEKGVVGDGVYNGKVIIINNGWWAGYDEATDTWSHGYGEQSPAIWVTWEGAKVYSEEVWGGRIPTQAEWLYAAQGGALSNSYTYAGGNTIDDVAQYWYDGGTKLFPVGLKVPNELGIYDMSGNATEFIQELSGANAQTMGGCTNASYHETLPLSDPGIIKTWSFTTEGSTYFAGFRVLIETSDIHSW